jgi:hypothetical protein
MAQTISLYEALGTVPDPRHKSGQRHPLQAVLTLCAVAMLSGAKSLYAIAQFGRDRGREFARALGFTRDQTISGTMLHYLFARLDGQAFEKGLSRWAAGRGQVGWKAVHLDGKSLRGTQGHLVPGVMVLAAYAHEAQVVLGQIPVDAKTNEHKTALQLLHLIPLQGKIVTGDAAFCQRDLSRKISKKGATGSGRSKRTKPTS